MAKFYNRIVPGTPTGLTPALAAGGALTPGTTYYYRVLAVLLGPGSTSIAFSLPCAEVSATPDADNKTVNLTWNAVAGASGYVVQRTTTPGSYPPSGTNTLTLAGQAYGGSIYFTTLTNLTDNGGASGNVRFNAGNLDFTRVIPVIEVYSNAGDTITLSDIYDASVAGGWGDLDIIAPAGLKADTNASWRDQAPYVAYGSLHIRDCTFRQRGILLVIGGRINFATTAKLEIGADYQGSGRVYAPYIGETAPYLVCKTIDNNTYNNSYYLTSYLQGVADSKVYDLIKRIINPVASVGNYTNVWLGTNVGVNVAMYRSIAGLKAYGSGFFLNSPLCLDNIWENLQPTVPVDTAVIRYSEYGLNLYYPNGCNIRCKDVRVVRSDRDLTAGYAGGTALIDCTWTALTGSTQANPYCGWSGKMAGRTVLHQFTFALRITDTAGNPISGASVVLLDALGNSALLVDSLATFSSALNATDVTSALTVSDGTKFSVGDIIRLETYTELYRVSGINGNVLTIQRGYGGTTKRATEYWGTANANRILKQAGSLNTGADGRVAIQPLINRELLTLKTDGAYQELGYENALVTAGVIGRTYFTPFTLTVSKTGYETLIQSLAVDRKLDLEKTLTAALPRAKVAGGSHLIEITRAA